MFLSLYTRTTPRRHTSFLLSMTRTEFWLFPIRYTHHNGYNFLLPPLRSPHINARSKHLYSHPQVFTVLNQAGFGSVNVGELVQVQQNREDLGKGRGGGGNPMITQKRSFFLYATGTDRGRGEPPSSSRARNCDQPCSLPSEIIYKE
jgi:hypothetical protein